MKVEILLLLLAQCWYCMCGRKYPCGQASSSNRVQRRPANTSTPRTNVWKDRPIPTRPPRRIGQHVIKGDRVVPPENWPWVMGMTFHGKGDPYCTATLVPICPGFPEDKTDVAITAAHCLTTWDNNTKTTREYLPTALQVFAGVEDQMNRRREFGKRAQNVVVRDFVTYPGWTAEPGGLIRYDLAVVGFQTPMNFTQYVRPLCLPKNVEKMPPTGRKQCYVAGWGSALRRVMRDPKTGDLRENFINPLHLMQAEVMAMDTTKCVEHLRAAYNTVSPAFVNMYHSFCYDSLLGNQWIGPGDSGGPYMCELQGKKDIYELVGVNIVGLTSEATLDFVTNIALWITQKMYFDWIFQQRRNISRFAHLCPNP